MIFSVKKALAAPLLLSTSLFLLACSDDEPTTPTVSQPYASGVIVVNEGNFSTNNGSVSFLSRTSTTATNGLFQLENNRPLTGIIEGYTEVDSLGLILVDNSSAGQDKVELVNAGTFKSRGTLAAPDIENPRQALKVASGKAYVTCWAATGQYPNFYPNPGYIAVIDLAQRKVTKKITLQKGAEGLVLVGSEVFVTGQGGEGLLQVVDVQTDAVKQSITLGGDASAVVLDANNKLWTLVGNEAVRINPSTKAVETRLKVGTDARKSPGNLTLSADRRTLFFTYTFYDAADNYTEKGELYKFGIDDTSIPASTPLVRKVFSGLGYDGQSNLLYAGFTPSYAQAGYVFRYQANGQLVDSVKVEIAPGAFFFKSFSTM